MNGMLITFILQDHHSVCNIRLHLPVDLHTSQSRSRLHDPYDPLKLSRRQVFQIPSVRSFLLSRLSWQFVCSVHQSYMKMSLGPSTSRRTFRFPLKGTCKTTRLKLRISLQVEGVEKKHVLASFKIGATLVLRAEPRNHNLRSPQSVICSHICSCGCIRGRDA